MRSSDGVVHTCKHPPGCECDECEAVIYSASDPICYCDVESTLRKHRLALLKKEEHDT